jgi:hypothetical protein
MFCHSVLSLRFVTPFCHSVLREEVSILRPIRYGRIALPLRHPAIIFNFILVISFKRCFTGEGFDPPAFRLPWHHKWCHMGLTRFLLRHPVLFFNFILVISFKRWLAREGFDPPSQDLLRLELYHWVYLALFFNFILVISFKRCFAREGFDPPTSVVLLQHASSALTSWNPAIILILYFYTSFKRRFVLPLP